MLHLAEVAPAGGAAVVIESLPYLFLLAGLIVALGLIKFVTAIVDALLYVIHKVVHRVPVIGPSFEKLARAAAQKITNALGSAEAKIDQYIGWCWHNMAHVVRWTFHVIAQLSYGLLVNSIAAQLHISRRQAARLIQAFLHPIRTLQAIEHKLLHALRGGVTIVTHTVGAHVLPRLGTAEAEIEHVIEWDIPRLRARSRAIERRLDRLAKWIRAHRKIVVSAAFVGAVAVALGKLGGSWIRCKNPRRVGKWLCGLPTHLIEDVLGLALAFLVVVDPVDIAKTAIKTEDLMHALVVKIADLNPEADDATQEALAALTSSL